MSAIQALMKVSVNSFVMIYFSISDMNSCMHDSSQSTLPEYLSSPLRNTPNKKPARSETTSQKDDLSKGDKPWIERDGLNGSVRDVSTHK